MAASILHLGRERHTPSSAMVLAGVKLTMLDPIVDHTFSDSEGGCNVGDSDLSRSERRRDLEPVDMAKPSYCCDVKWASGSGAEASNAERRSDLVVATCTLLSYELDRTEWRTAAGRTPYQ